MEITLDSDLDTAVREVARRQGVSPESLVVNVLRHQFLTSTVLQPRDEWERGLLAAARDCGVSLPDSAVSSEGLYE